jgi:hypothetical protein
MKSIWFNAHHSPIGAFASFTLGYPGQKGGFGLEMGKPADQNVYIGLESTEKGQFQALPFFAGAGDDAARYDIEKTEGADKEIEKSIVSTFANDEVTREYNLSSDIWKAGDLTFAIYSPVRSIPDPATASAAEMAAVTLPAVMVEITVDNTKCATSRDAFFGFMHNSLQGFVRRLEDTTDGKLKGIGEARHFAIAGMGDDIDARQGFTIEDLLAPKIKENTKFGIAATVALVMTVPAGVKKTFRLAVCFHRDGYATAGLDTTYYYRRFYKNIEEVAAYALENFDTYISWSKEADATLLNSKLNDDQRFMLAHAVRSYYGSTEFLDYLDKPLWVVNEGEYRMMNTFDLTVDQVFYEMKMNPWTVRNVLDMYASRYSYYDTVHFQGDPTAYPGGLSFTHDMGTTNVFSRPQFSSYELFGLDDCFSHMTHEQLVNWICCAATYYKQTGDNEWIDGKISVLRDCLRSMLNRDNPDPAKRNGVMSLDSDRCLTGAEITTYDSLDISLGQARNNVYLAVKSWAAYVALDNIFTEKGLEEEASIAVEQALRCANTLSTRLTAEGYIPAVIDEGNDSKIIPAIEGLAFPYVMGLTDALDINGKYGNLIRTMSTHLNHVLNDDICLFPDGGWKLSSTSDNSWLSKIYLCQFIARKILGLSPAKTIAADVAHVGWLLDPRNAYYSWSDQILRGIAKGSLYYPRGVTSILWLSE